MASENCITATIFIMVLLFSSAPPVIPLDSPVIACQPWCLCGMVAYNPQKSQCCQDGSVQSLSLRCGPALSYDPCSQYCCPDSFKQRFIVVDKSRTGTVKSDCEMALSN